MLSKTASLREKCPYSEFFWSTFSHIRTEYGAIKLRIRTIFTKRLSNKNNIKKLRLVSKVTIKPIHYLVSLGNLSPL